VLSPVIDLRTAQRSLVATLEITALTCGAHVLAGGELPSPGFLLALGAVVFACSLATFGRVVRAVTVVPVVLATQIGLHAAFATAEPMHAMPGMAGTGSSGLWHLEPTMFWAHLVTAVVTAIVLLTQERVLAAVVTWLARITPVAASAAPLLRGTFVVARSTRRSLLRTSPRRGPPVLLAHAA
jgi:hypothetical protein